MKLKIVLGVFGLFLISMMLSQTVYAEDVITSRTGTIMITRPDGAVFTIGKDESLPDITSGSIVVVLDGSIDIVPTAGFIQLVVGDSAATVKPGDTISAFVDLKTGMAGFKTSSGEINVVTGNTTATVKVGQEALMSLDKTTGEVSIKSVTGVIQTVTIGVKTQVFEGRLAKISVNARTRIVHIESFRDNVLLTVVDVQGSLEDKIQTFVETSREVELSLPEEPVEPQRPEGSPYAP